MKRNAVKCSEMQNLAPSYRDLKDPTSRQNFWDTLEQQFVIYLRPCHTLNILKKNLSQIFFGVPSHVWKSKHLKGHSGPRVSEIFPSEPHISDVFPSEGRSGSRLSHIFPSELLGLRDPPKKFQNKQIPPKKNPKTNFKKEKFQKTNFEEDFFF